jgi:predicted ATPase/class 3 adenylate cyclase
MSWSGVGNVELEMDCPGCGTRNPESANFCLQCGRSLKPTDRPRSFVEWLQAGAQTEAERRQVTILACDAVRSSLLAERMDPEEFLELMNRAFEAILAPVFHYGGYLARLEGDGFKAFFGAPEAHEDDPLRAVRAGLQIQAAARCIAEEFAQEGRAAGFSVRVGVHTDYVVVGPVGTGDTFEYTAMGIGIVLAQRLETLAQPGSVLISDTTRRLVEPYVEVVPLGPTVVKGRTQPVHVFEVTGLRAADELGEVLGVRSQLVGRNVELAMLRSAVTRLLDGSERSSVPERLPSSELAGLTAPEGGGGQILSRPVTTAQVTRRCGGVVHVVGEAGVGKSRLINHVRNEMIAEHPQLIWLDGRALLQGQGAYGVLADLLRGYLGIGPGDRMADTWTRLCHRMTHLFPPLSSGEESSGEAADLIPHLANLLSLHLDGDAARRVNDLDPEAQERQIFRALRRLFERLTDAGPLVLTFDDLHAADDATIRLLGDLMQLIEERPLLLVFSFRPQLDVACWQLRDIARRAYRKESVEIILHGLSSAASSELIENLLESPEDGALAESIQAMILDRSGGNPLYIEEVVRSLIDRGVLQRSNSHWQVVSVVPPNFIPETLHGVILARLDRLDTATRRLLQIAAVIGCTFSLPVLQAVAQDSRNLSDQLVYLQRAELIRELRRSTEQEYSFTHPLTQQVAYQTLLRRQRREYHRRVAQSIKELYADRLEEHYERLAYHYASAEDWSRALEYHIRFADQAQLRYANAKAAEHYQSAWEIVASGRAGDDGTRCRLYEAQGNLDLLAGNYQQAARRYEGALALVQDPLHRARLLRKLGNVCQGSGDYERGIGYIERGLELAPAIGYSPELASLYAGLGQIYHRENNYQQAVKLGLMSLEIFERLDDQRGMALASNLLGITYWAMSDLDTASAYLEKSLLIHASLGDVYGLAASYNNLGQVLADQGQLERALRNLRQSQQLCLEIGYQHGLATALSHLSELYQRLGQTEEALGCQEQAFEIYNRIGFDGTNVQPEVLKMQVW